MALGRGSADARHQRMALGDGWPSRGAGAVRLTMPAIMARHAHSVPPGGGLCRRPHAEQGPPVMHRDRSLSAVTSAPHTATLMQDTF